MLNRRPLQATSIAINPCEERPRCGQIGFEAVIKTGNTPAELRSMLGKEYGLRGGVKRENRKRNYA